MSIQIIRTTMNFEVVHDFPMIEFGWIKLLIGNNVFPFGPNKEKFKKAFGSIILNDVAKEPTFFCSLDGEYDLEQVSNQIFTITESMFLFLWFIKDHSVSLGSVFGYDTEKKRFFLRHPPEPSSSANGGFVEARFNPEELFEAYNLYTKYQELSDLKDLTSKNEIKKVLDSKVYSENVFNSFHHKTLNRFDRSILFVQMARRESYLPMKISLYVCVLEVLFSPTDDSISHQIAERSAIYSSENLARRKEVYQLVKRAYAIRSQLFHGQPFQNKNNPETLLDTSREVDSLLRGILYRVLTIDNSLFNEKSDQITEWFKEKILS